MFALFTKRGEPVTTLSVLDIPATLLRDPVGEYVDILARRSRLSVSDADAVERVARGVRRFGGSRAAACEAARRAVDSLRGAA